MSSEFSNTSNGVNMIRTSFRAIRAVRDLTGYTLRVSKQQVDAIVVLTNNGNGVAALYGAALDIPNGMIPVEVVEQTVLSNAKEA